MCVRCLLHSGELKAYSDCHGNWIVTQAISSVGLRRAGGETNYRDEVALRAEESSALVLRFNV